NTTNDHVIVVPPKGAVTCNTTGSVSVPVALNVPVNGDSAATPSILASARHDRPVAGHRGSAPERGSGATDTVAAYCNDTSFSITHGDPIVSPIASPNVATSPAA